MALTFTYQFFPVGQGLFTYAELGAYGTSKIRWVYDCGTTSAQNLLDTQLNALVSSQGAIDHIDLLFISHFDKDHISGVAKLLGKFKVGAILLPYITPVQLLVHAIQGGVEPGDPEFGFFINPSDYLAAAAERAEKRVDRIVYVPPSDGEGPEVPNYDSAPDGDEIGAPEITVVPLPDGSDHLQVSGGRATPTVGQLAANSVIKSGRVWEFVMYNDAPPADLLGLDVAAVSTQRDILMSAASTVAEKDAAMKEIKKLFHEKLRDGHEKNLISLFVYAGPVYAPRDHGYVEVDMDMGHHLGFWMHEHFHHGPPRRFNHWLHGSILYTGDGYLNEAPQLRRLTTYLRGMRIARTTVLQVMHHGSKANWHQGVAAALHPHFSVFSSDPAHRGFGHPHAPVVQDFQPYNVFQVDRNDGFQVRFHRS